MKYPKILQEPLTLRACFCLSAFKYNACVCARACVLKKWAKSLTGPRGEVLKEEEAEDGVELGATLAVHPPQTFLGRLLGTTGVG